MTNGGPPSGGPRSLFRPSALSGVANNLIKKQEDELKEKETAQRSAEKHKPSDDDQEPISAKKPALEQEEASVPKAKEEDTNVSQSAEAEANTSSNASTSAAVSADASVSASAGASASANASASTSACASATENPDASTITTTSTTTSATVQAEADKDTKPKQEGEEDTTAKTATTAKYDFVFGENVKDRVLLRTTGSDSRKTENGQQKTDDDGSTKKDESESGATEDAAKTTDSDSKFLKGASDSTKSNTEPARAPEELLTGEEGERNVLQVFGRLFVFNGTTKNWQERGRGYLRLNDVDSQKQVQLNVQGHSHVTTEQQQPKSDETKPESSEASHLPDASNSGSTGETEKGQFVAPTSRIVMRRHGTQSVMLNSPIFAKMEVGRVDDKRLRFTAQCVDEAGLHTVRIFCVTAASKDVQSLYDALLQRRDQLVSSSSALSTGSST